MPAPTTPSDSPTTPNDPAAPAGCFPVAGSPGLFNCPAGVLPESNPLSDGRTRVPAGAASQISNYRVPQYDAPGPSYTLGGVNYWWREEYVPFKNLTAENLAAFQANYISDDPGSLDWPSLDDLIAHSLTKSNSGDNVDYASDEELSQRFARLDKRLTISECDKKIISVIIDLVTLFMGGREWIKRRTLAQLEEFFIHANLPLRDATRCLNVLHFGNEVPYFTKAQAILRLLKFVFKGGLSTTIWGVWGIIVKNLSWKDMVLYGVEMGAEWVSFFATDGIAAGAVIVNALARGAFLTLDFSDMLKACINSSIATSPSSVINTGDSFGLCVMAIDFPSPPPPGGFLPKSQNDAPDYFTANNTVIIQTDDATGTRFLSVNGMGFIMSQPNALVLAFQPLSLGGQRFAFVVDGVETILNGKYQGSVAVGSLSRTMVKDSGLNNYPIPQSFQQEDSGNSDLYHFQIVKINLIDPTHNDSIYDMDQILLKAVKESSAGTDQYLGLIYDSAYQSGNYTGYYVGITKNPQVWTVFKTPFNP